MIGHTRQREDVPELVVELLKARAERLRLESTAEAEDESVLWVAEFMVGTERYALPLRSLRSALPLRAVTPVPLAMPYVIGILRFQGQMITAFSLASLLGVRGWTRDPSVLLVLELEKGHLTALDCEETPRPISLPLSRVEEAKSRGKGPVFEVTTTDIRQVSLIDLQALLQQVSGEVRHAG